MRIVNNLLLIGIAAALLGCNTPVENPNDKTPNGDSVPVRDVMTYVTTADGTMGFVAVGKDYIEGLNMSPERTLKLNPKVRYQEFEGFGAAITGAAAFNLMQMPADRRQKLLVETFSHEKGMGYGYVRVPIGGSDFNSRSNYDYTCCDTKSIENFGLTSDEVDYIIPVLKEILAINPDLKVMGTPWSCPIWMKVDDIHSKAPYTGKNKWVGGYLNPDYYQDYAMYFVKWIKAFEAEGIKITSVTPQNEPLNWGNSMSLTCHGIKSATLSSWHSVQYSNVRVSQQRSFALTITTTMMARRINCNILSRFMRMQRQANISMVRLITAMVEAQWSWMLFIS